MIEYVIPVLAFLAVFLLGGSYVLRTMNRRAAIRERLQREQRRAHDGAEAPARPSILTRAVAAIGTVFGAKDPSTTLRGQMVRAGFTGALAVPVYMGAKLLLFLLGGIVSGVSVVFLDISIVHKVIIVAMASGLPFFIPNILVSTWIARRTEEVRVHLPDVIDLLEICVGGGMGLDMAWIAVSNEIRAVSPMLADEMALTNLEMHLGEERGDAIRHMAERTGATDLNSLVAVLVQSERFGTSVSDALKVFATSMREERSQRAEEAAEKMGTKMIFPMVLCILPCVFIVAVGPAVIKIIEAFSQM